MQEGLPPFKQLVAKALHVTSQEQLVAGLPYLRVLQVTPVLSTCACAAKYCDKAPVILLVRCKGGNRLAARIHNDCVPVRVCVCACLP